MKCVLVAFGLVIAPLSIQASIDQEWGRHSDPSIRSKLYERNFSMLPLSGSPADMRKLWASDWWPNRKGSINRRWNTATQVGFRLVSPNRDAITTMTQSDLAALAPSEKFDLLIGDYNYSLVKEVSRIANPRAPEWYGICHGWAPAAVNHVEPTAKTLISNDGIRIPFGSSDIKALLSYYYAYYHEVESTRQVGKRCFFLNPGCRDEDLNAGAFHISIANTLGIQKESMILDIESSELVWNQAVNGYHSTIVNDQLRPSDDSARGTLHRIRVKTAMSYVKEIKANSWAPTNGTVAHVNDVKHYEYFLDINAKGKIIGGNWISKTRPDFIWSMDKATTFTGKFARLAELLND
jgi:hypothetical protein